MSEFHHVSVLLEECIEGLAIKPDGIYVDGTLGGAGHSSRIAAKLTTGRLIGIDRDNVALEAAAERLKPYEDRVTLVHANSATWMRRSRNWASTRWTAFCWIWGFPLPSWTTGSGAFPI